MDWRSLWIGALAGGVVGLVIQNIMFPLAVQRVRAVRRQRAIRKSAESWSRFEEIFCRLVLVQAGWDSNGCFVEGTVVFRLVGLPFTAEEEVEKIRALHESDWKTTGLTDDKQIGIKEFSVQRVSDNPSIERDGMAHRITLSVHEYRYFSFLATHMSRLRGSANERAILDTMAASAARERPVDGFPTPCSVGLAVIVEGGRRILLPRRSIEAGSGGAWEGGKIFNAAGENTSMRDFEAAHRSPGESTPEVVARRALCEEVGLRDSDIGSGRLRIHSFAWAPDLLDFKFFGIFETSLTESEVLTTPEN